MKHLIEAVACYLLVFVLLVCISYHHEQALDDVAWTWAGLTALMFSCFREYCKYKVLTTK